MNSTAPRSRRWIDAALAWYFVDVLPGALTLLGIAVTCAGVALAVWKSRSDPSAAVD